MALFSDSCESLTPSIFKVFISFVDGSMPVWSLRSTVFQFFWLDFTPLEVCFYSVLVPFSWVALLTFTTMELSVQQLSGNSVLLSDDMAHPSQLGLDELSFNAGGVGTA